MSGMLDVSAFWDAPGSLTLEERTYRFLHEMISSGALAPGSRIVGSRLAAVLGVSRITIANALKRLSSEGFVIVTPHREAVVASLDEASLNEIFRVRYALEAEVMREVATSIDPATLDRLRELDRRIQRSVAFDRPDEYRRHERDYHLLIYEASGLPLVASMLTELWYRLEPYRGRRYSSETLLASALDDHRAILQSLAERDAEAAVRTMKVHVERGHRRFLHVLHPEVPDAMTPPVRAGGGRQHPQPAAPRWISPPGSLRAAFDSLEDSRRRQGQTHAHGAVLTLAVCAMLCGASSRYAITRWGQECHPAIRGAIGCRQEQAPSGATVHRVFVNLKPGEFERVLHAWLAQRGFRDVQVSQSFASEGVHGERLPGADVVAAVAAHLRTHLTAVTVDTADLQSGVAMHWQQFLGLLLHGTDVRREASLAELQLRQAVLQQDGG